MVPDYNLRVSEVFRQLSWGKLSGNTTLIALNFDLEKKSHPELPSWVIDWTHTEHAGNAHHYFQLPLYGATRHKAPSVTAFDDFTISVSSIKFDTISSVGDMQAPIHQGVANVVSVSPARVRVMRNWHLLAKLHQDPDREYPTGCTWFEAYWRTLCGDTMFDTQVGAEKEVVRRANAGAMSAYVRWSMVSIDSPFRSGGLTEDEKASFYKYPGFGKPAASFDGPAYAFATALEGSTARRRLFLTERGFLGLGRSDIRVGDEIHLLIGGYTPFVLRKATKDLLHDEAPPGPTYALVGDCYVHGIMDGEAMGDEDECEKRIYLR